MAYLAFLFLLGLGLLFPRVELLRCWSCSSDLIPTCSDPFVPEHSHLLHLADCGGNAALLSTFQAVCRKQKHLIHGKTVTSRDCAYKPFSDLKSKTCPRTTEAIRNMTTWCEACNYEGCNGSVAVGGSVAQLAITFLLFNNYLYL